MEQPALRQAQRVSKAMRDLKPVPADELWSLHELPITAAGSATIGADFLAQRESVNRLDGYCNQTVVEIRPSLEGVSNRLSAKNIEIA
jgi:hypothetical protein